MNYYIRPSSGTPTGATSARLWHWVSVVLTTLIKCPKVQALQHGLGWPSALVHTEVACGKMRRRTQTPVKTAASKNKQKQKKFGQGSQLPPTTPQGAREEHNEVAHLRKCEAIGTEQCASGARFAHVLRRRRCAVILNATHAGVAGKPPRGGHEGTSRDVRPSNLHHST